MYCLISGWSLSPLADEDAELAKVVWDQEQEGHTGTF